MSSEQGRPKPEWNPNTKQLQEKQTRQLPEGTKTVHITARRADIYVKGSSPRERAPSVSSKLIVSGVSEEQAREVYDNHEGELKIKAQPDEAWIDTSSEEDLTNNGMKRIIALSVPKGRKLNYDVKEGDGSVHFTDVDAHARIRTDGAPVALHTVQGVFHVGTNGGDIGGETVTGELRARTFSGTVDVSDLEGKAELHSEIGDVSLREAQLQGPRNDVTTGLGDVTVEVVNDELSIKAFTTAGEIALREHGVTLGAHTETEDGMTAECFIGEDAAAPHVLDLSTDVGRILFFKKR